VATSLGSSAVPGAAWPGAGWPGVPLSTAAVTAWTFSGPEQLFYPSYIDLQAGHTLVATPGGGPYQILQAGAGDPVQDADSPVPPPDGFWSPA
jgi:hypothetical protein